MVDIGVNTILKNMPYVKGTIELDHFLSIRHAHGDLRKHLEIDSSTDLYSNLSLNAYINRHAHTEYLKMIEVYSPFGIWHVFLYSINTNIYLFRSMKYPQYTKFHQIDVYIYQCDNLHSYISYHSLHVYVDS